MTILLLIALSFYTPVASAKLCGNVVVHDEGKEKAIRQVMREGCDEVRMVELENDYFLVYGVKILRSESDAAGGSLDNE